MESSVQQPGIVKRAMTTGRRKGAACERCNRRRTKCDGWIIGVPCSACKKSNNHKQCTIMQSKRRRGPDGRYTFASDGEPRPRPSNSNTDDAISPARISGTLPASNSGLDAESGDSAAGSARTRASDGNDLSEYDANTLNMRAREGHRAKRKKLQRTAQPSFVGESWYASYVMRGYAPGNTSFHRSIDDCNETVRSISRDASNQECANRSLPSPDRANSSDLPPRSLMDRLVNAYFERFHAFCPIVSKKSFLSEFQDGRVSGTLLRSVLFVASLHCDMEILHLMGHSTRLTANDDLFTKASATFDADRESDKISMVLASYLLHYWFGNPTTYRDAHWWLAAAIRSAQCMGYHRSTKNTQLPATEKSRWKLIWWCLYVRDRQTSLSTGTPMVINDLDHDVEELLIEDMPDDTPETAKYIISQIELNKAAARLYFLYCSPSRLVLSRDPSMRQVALDDLYKTLRSWYDTAQGLNVSNGNHHLSLTLKVCYYYYLINLHQRLQRQGPKAKENKLLVDAAGCVFSLVEDSLLYWTPERFPMIYVSALFSAMIALVADYSASPPEGGRLLDTIRLGLLALKQFEPVYVLARWIRNFFMDILSRSETRPGDETAKAGDKNDVQPTTPQSDSHASADKGVAYTGTPLPADHLTAEPPNFVFGHGAQVIGSDDGDLLRGVREFWPTYMTDSVFSGSHAGNEMEFPQPDSLQYQALYFLAGLGVSDS